MSHLPIKLVMEMGSVVNDAVELGCPVVSDVLTVSTDAKVHDDLKESCHGSVSPQPWKTILEKNTTQISADFHELKNPRSLAVSAESLRRRFLPLSSVVEYLQVRLSKPSCRRAIKGASTPGHVFLRRSVRSG